MAGFSFSRSELLLEVPYDPHLPFLFFGEESIMSVRLFTHGWDLFCPGRTIIYHLWERIHRPNFRSFFLSLTISPLIFHRENPDPHNLEDRSRRRVRFLLGEMESPGEESLVEIERYGLGKSRTLQDYQVRFLSSVARPASISRRRQACTSRPRSSLRRAVGAARAPICSSSTSWPR